MSKIVQLRNILLGYIVLEEVRYWDFLISPENPRDKVSDMEKSNNVRKVAVGDVLSGKHYVCNRETRHNFVGEIRIFSVKIRINPYPSYMHQCIAKTFTRFISRCSFCKKKS